MKKRHWLIRSGFLWLIVTSIVVIFLAQRVSNRIPQTTGEGSDSSTVQAVITTPDSIPSKTAETPQSPLPTPLPTTPPEIVWQVAEATRVENGPYQNMQWSPDGTQLLVSKQYTQYLLKRDKGDPISVPGLDQPLIPGIYAGLSDLWLIDRITGTEKLLLSRIGRYTWSPDGKDVAYLVPINDEGTEGAIYTFNIASGISHRMASVDFLGSEYSPQWLPNGKLIFVRDGQILVQPAIENGTALATGLNFRKITNDTEYTSPPGTPDRFRFSPDGRRVVYMTKGNTYRALAYQLWLADADGGNAQMITEQAEGSYYEWSPDGKWLIFNTYRDIDDPVLDTRLPPIGGLWAVRADGTDPRRLYKVEGWRGILSPVWSPDSQLIAFRDESLSDASESPESSKARQQNQIRIVNITTMQPISLAGVPSVLDDLSGLWWSADGRDLFALKHLAGYKEYETYRLRLAPER